MRRWIHNSTEARTERDADAGFEIEVAEESKEGMNVAQLGQNIEAPAVNAIAEAVRGLARDRSLLVKELRETNRSWHHFDAFAQEQAAKIEALDRRIDGILAMSTANAAHDGRQGETP